MTFRKLGSLLAAYFLALTVTASVLRAHVAVDEPSAAVTVRSTWKDGVRVARQVLEGEAGPLPAGAADEKIVGEGPIAMGKTFFPFGLVAGRDGVKATMDGKTAYATVDDLVSVQAYDHATSFMDASFGIGTHRAAVLQLLASQLGVEARELDARGSFRRVRFERARGSVSADNVTTERAREAIREGAHQLARLVDANGRFRYLFDATSGKILPGYNWPRHSGATYFLAQAAAMLDDAEVRYACLRAASQLRDVVMTSCGTNKCIAADNDDADVGSSALALVAFSEIVRTGADPGYAVAVSQLAAFLRSQQRADGELMHYFDRNQGQPIDVQVMYYTGEAALGLSRAHRVTKDPRDLDAAKRALDHLSGAGWTFFGSRYYYGEEHWTCQATEDLWDRAPNEDALGFCLRWHEFQRRIQHASGDSPYDAEGAFGVGPVTSPRVTPASSRGEAAVAALGVLLREKRKAHPIHEEDIPLLDRQLRRSVSFVLRHQMVPGNVTWAPHLFARPDEVRGAFPGSPVDWQLRIDYVQHAGSLLVRWVETMERDRAANLP